MFMRLFRFALSAMMTLALAAGPAMAADFTYNEQANKDLAKRLGIPVYLALPASARLPLSNIPATQDKLIDFQHPDGVGAQGDVGLRVVIAKRAGMGRRLAQAGLLQTGDILLTFRPEWGGSGAYPNIQMGVSHTSLVYVKDGVAYHIDIPLTAEYLGPQLKGDFTGEHFRTLKFLHVIRPRNLDAKQREAIAAWASALVTNARRIYPEKVAFNQDYNAPKYKPGKPLQFVHQLGQAALGQSIPAKLDLYCSEFVWSILAMRNCPFGQSGEAFKGSSVPSCVKPAMEPMQATGDYITRRGRTANIGLADGPLVVIDALKLPAEKREAMIRQVFTENPGAAAKMSVGHRTLAKDMQPKFAPLETYYKRASAGGFSRIPTWFMGRAIDKEIPDNYSPTSFLINTLLPPSNVHRTMDYVATILIE